MLKFRSTQFHGNADALSRLPLQIEPSEAEQPPGLVLLMDHLSNSPVTAQHIRAWTVKDSTLRPVLQAIQQGCPEESTPDLDKFFPKRHELSSLDGCICGDLGWSFLARDARQC